MYKKLFRRFMASVAFLIFLCNIGWGQSALPTSSTGITFTESGFFEGWTWDLHITSELNKATFNSNTQNIVIYVESGANILLFEHNRDNATPEGVINIYNSADGITWGAAIASPAVTTGDPWLSESITLNPSKPYIKIQRSSGVGRIALRNIQIKADFIFTYTGADQTFTVPACACEVEVHLWGAGGGGANNDNQSVGGGGAYVTGILEVIPGEVLTIVVGERGKNSTAETSYGGGAAQGESGPGGSGGGRSAICRGTPTVQANNIVVAGGGGGCGRSGGGSINRGYGGPGGAGGLANGQNGEIGACAGEFSFATGGGGGTQVAGGFEGIKYPGCGGCTDGSPGTALTGGKGGQGGGSEKRAGGGGGGGYYGGGGGGGNSRTSDGFTGCVLSGGGGGGGSSFLVNLSNSDNSEPGNGQTQGCATCQPVYNNNQYGRGGNRDSHGQHGFVVIIPIADTCSSLPEIDTITDPY